MNTLTKTICTGLVSSSLIFGCCENKKEPLPEYIKIQGTVFSERYMPATAGGFGNPSKESRYSFSIDTKEGRKIVEVGYNGYGDGGGCQMSRENADAMIEPGTKVEIEIEISKKDQKFYRVCGEKITILDSLSSIN